MQHVGDEKGKHTRSHIMMRGSGGTLHLHPDPTVEYGFFRTAE
jgi:hypothetical protein